MPAPAKRKPGRPTDVEATSRRRQVILSSASRMFAAHGYAQTNLDRLAAELDLSKGTIYRYFRSKSELFFATVDSEFQRLMRSVPKHDAHAAGNPLDQIVKANVAYLEFFRENPHTIELIMQERAAFPDRMPRIAGVNNPILEKWGGLFHELMDAGYLRRMPIGGLLEYLSNLLYGTVMSDTLRQPDRDLEVFARDVVDVIFRGIATEKARREWKLTDE